MKILYGTSEAVPFAAASGLGQVAGSLPAALSARGHDVRIIMPRYGQIDADRHSLDTLIPEVKVRLGAAVQTGCLLRGELPGTSVPVYFVRHEAYFDRFGLYDDDGVEYEDNAERFGFFSMAALLSLDALNWRPDVIWCNDWQTALIPVLLRNHPQLSRLRENKRIKVLFTIHDLMGYDFLDRSDPARLCPAPNPFGVDGLESYGKMNLLKAGIVYSDKISSASQQYIRSIQSEPFGCGLEEILAARKKDLVGIRNGIDPRVWSPEVDPWIPAHYLPRALSGKAQCKAELQRRCGLAERPYVPLIGVVSRLSELKGLDLVAAAAEQMMKMDLQFVLVGSGQKPFHDFLEKLADEHPDKAKAHLGFDNALAHQVIAGADVFLAPSRHEPCGLNPLYALRYGTIPIVNKAGGLGDSILTYKAAGQNGTADGFVFVTDSPHSMLGALRRAVELYHHDAAAWARLRETAMKQDFTWAASARRYETLLSEMVGTPQAHFPHRSPSPFPPAPTPSSGLAVCAP